MVIKASVVTALAALLATGVAWADAVPMPPDNDDCPNGARGETCHGGPFCMAWSCSSDSDCRDGRVCRDAGLCIGTLDCTGGWGSHTSETAEATCAPGGSCERGTCETRRVCVRPGPPPPDASPVEDAAPDADGPDDGGFPSRRYGCGCGVGGGAEGGALPALAVALLFLAIRRRC